MDKTVEELLSMMDGDLERLFTSRLNREPNVCYKELSAHFPEVGKALKKKGDYPVRFMAGIH